MTHRKIIAGVAGLLAVAVAGTSVAVGAQSAASPKRAIVKEKTGIKIKPNRYIQDQLRWDKDVYKVRKGGTVVAVGNVVSEGPHTLSVVKRRQLPKTINCKVCNALGKAHGFDPNDEGPPKFLYLENGKGQSTPPDLNKPGDSAVFGLKKGDKVRFKVTAKVGATLNFVCAVHPWMQAKVNVVK
jgi:hypothetical protein